MRLAVFLCLSALFAAVAVDAKRWGAGGSSRRGGSGSRPKTPSQPTRSDTFINHERGTSIGTTHNRPNPFNPPPAPKPHTPIGFDKVNSPSAPQPPKPPTVVSNPNGPIGFDKVNGAGNQQGSHHIGFDKVNSDAQNKAGNPHVPSAPPYPGAPNGPPPAYYPGSHTGNSYSGAGDHPPAYPGRPVNAPPSYSAGNPYGGQTHPSQAGYPGQQQGFGNGFGYPQQNPYGGSHPAGGSSYPSNTGFFPASGSYPHTTSYQGNTYGGSPFGNNGYNGNPNYNPNNFGYSSNPGYFGNQGGYSNYPGQYDSSHKKSRFGGLPIPIPIPIPIPFGGGGFGGLGGLGGFGGYSHNHRLLDTFIKDQNNTQSGNSSTSVFILNNSTVTPCTTDHFVYELLKVSVVSCTAEFCTAVKVSTTTNISNVVSVHSAALTMCMENNVTYSHYGEKVTPEVSDLRKENITVCRDVVKNATVVANETATIKENSTESATTVPTTTVDATTTHETSTEITTTPSPTVSSNTSKVCETVDCSHVEMCLPAIEVMDKCTTADCPFRRTGYKPCVTIKMCRAPSNPLSTFATLNTTISKIDEFNRQNSVFDAANLTLISYHRPVITFTCPQNGTGPGCPPQPTCVPGNSTLCATPLNSTNAQ